MADRYDRGPPRDRRYDQHRSSHRDSYSPEQRYGGYQGDRRDSERGYGGREQGYRREDRGGYRDRDRDRDQRSRPTNRAPAPAQDAQFLGPTEIPGLLGGPACARLPDIIQIDGLRSVIICTFEYDLGFIADAIPPGIPLQVVCPNGSFARPSASQPERNMSYFCSVCRKDHAERRGGYRGQRDRRPDPACDGGYLRKIELVHPPFAVEGGIFHAKMLLLDYGRYLRVVITSANFTALDWGSIGQMVWRQDFPSAGPHDPSPFEMELTNFVNAVGCDSSFISRFSFAAATATLICSIPGEHRGDMAKNFGHLRLRSIVSEHVWAPTQVPPLPAAHIEVQTSSMGGSHRNWFAEFLSSALASKDASSDSPSGDAVGDAPAPAATAVEADGEGTAVDIDNSTEGVEEVQGDAAASERKRSRRSPAPKMEQLRIIYPSEASVRAAASIVPGFAEVGHYINYHDNARAMRPYLYEALQPAERTILWHSKIIVRTVEIPGSSDGSTPEGVGSTRRCQWAYVGSHNLTAAAWGSLDRDGETLRVRNYELGLLFLPEHVEGTVPTLPMTLPLPAIPSSLRHYATNDRPWSTPTGAVAEMQGTIAMWKGYAFATPMVMLAQAPLKHSPPPPATPAPPNPVTDWAEEGAEAAPPASPQVVVLDAPSGLVAVDSSTQTLMEGDRPGRVFVSAEIVRRCLGLDALEAGGKVRLEARETQKGWDAVWILHYEPPAPELPKRTAPRGRVNLNSLTEALQDQGVPSIQFKGQPTKRDPRQFHTVYAKLPEGPGFGAGRGRPAVVRPS